MKKPSDDINGKKVPGPLSQELAEWSREFRTRWFRSHPETDLPHGRRKIVASVGAFVYLFLMAWYFLGREPYFSLILGSGTFLGFVAFAFFLAVLALGGSAYFLGGLVVFQDKNGGPVRAFLGGVALPAMVMAIMGLSLRFF